MTETVSPTAPRTAGTIGAIAALAGVVIAAINQFFPPAVPLEQTSYPFPADGFVAIELVLTAVHIGVFVLAWAAFRNGAAGRGRFARVAWVIALVGFALQIPAEFGFAFVGAQPVDVVVPTVLSSVFGVSSILVAVGMLLVGIATLRARVWTGWRRFTPLIVGITSTILIPLVFVPAARNGALLVWCLSLALWGIALASSRRAA